MRLIVPFVIAALVAGCAVHQTGPTRPITIDDDVALMKVLAQPQPEDLWDFAQATPAKQAAMRNQIVTARMYIADMEYHNYEARLTKDIQEEGLAATLVSLGLTTSSTLIAPAGTKAILSGIATAVTGADKAFDEKLLLSNTIQALQTQMRADRKEQAGIIFARLFKSPGAVTPIAEYTLPMALSDVDAYYQAGTISSALIGLSKTVATKEARADEAKSQAGPNAPKVAVVRETATPRSNSNVVPNLRTSAPTVQTTFVRTDSSLALRSWIRPNGIVDQSRVDQVNKFIASKNLNPVPQVTTFLNGAAYSAERDELARQLGLIR